jgi:hypothetical protein
VGLARVNCNFEKPLISYFRLFISCVVDYYSHDISPANQNIINDMPHSPLKELLCKDVGVWPLGGMRKCSQNGVKIQIFIPYTLSKGYHNVNNVHQGYYFGLKVNKVVQKIRQLL